MGMIASRFRRWQELKLPPAHRSVISCDPEVAVRRPTQDDTLLQENVRKQASLFQVFTSEQSPYWYLTKLLGMNSYEIWWGQPFVLSLCSISVLAQHQRWWQKRLYITKFSRIPNDTAAASVATQESGCCLQSPKSPRSPWRTLGALLGMSGTLQTVPW